jgi:hypothetical protein
MEPQEHAVKSDLGDLITFTHAIIPFETLNNTVTGYCKNLMYIKIMLYACGCKAVVNVIFQNKSLRNYIPLWTFGCGLGGKSGSEVICSCFKIQYGSTSSNTWQNNT